MKLKIKDLRGLIREDLRSRGLRSRDLHWSYPSRLHGVRSLHENNFIGPDEIESALTSAMKQLKTIKIDGTYRRRIIEAIRFFKGDVVLVPRSGSQIGLLGYGAFGFVFEVLADGFPAAMKVTSHREAATYQKIKELRSGVPRDVGAALPEIYYTRHTPYGGAVIFMERLQPLPRGISLASFGGSADASHAREVFNDSLQLALIKGLPRLIGSLLDTLDNLDADVDRDQPRFTDRSTARSQADFQKIVSRVVQLLRDDLPEIKNNKGKGNSGNSSDKAEDDNDNFRFRRIPLPPEDHINLLIQDFLIPTVKDELKRLGYDPPPVRVWTELRDEVHQLLGNTAARFPYNYEIMKRKSPGEKHQQPDPRIGELYKRLEILGDEYGIEFNDAGEGNVMLRASTDELVFVDVGNFKISGR